MPTVILGGGIIGFSTAYYLSQQGSSQEEKDEIHIVDTAEELFTSASGYAAGFIAKDWFGPSLLPLGEYSFALHESLAAEHGGDKKWGYMKGTAMSLGLSLGATSTGGKGQCDDWVRNGTSRAEAAAGSPVPVPVSDEEGPGPNWLTRQKGAEIERISEGDDVAQVDPARLCKFLREASISRGVKVHHPSQATTLLTDPNGTITGLKLLNLSTKSESVLPCTNLLLAAGSWTPRVFSSLFPSSKTRVPIYPLAGYSLVIRSPRYKASHEEKNGHSHAIFTTYPPSCGFSPEVFSREGAEIYIAGLNDPTVPVPERVEDLDAYYDKEKMRRMNDVTVRLMGKVPDGLVEASDEVANENDLDVVREGLCLRPVAERGVPFVSRVEDSCLGGLKTAREGGLFVAAGHGPWGISLSLGTGNVVADLIRGVKPAVDISRLGLKS